MSKQYEWVSQFQKVIICMDEDKAGRKAAEDIVKVLPKGKAFVMRMRYNDPNEYLMEGSAQDFINDFWNHRPHVPDGIKSSAEGFDDIEEELLAPRLSLPPYMYKMQKMMGGGIQQGRIVNIIAATSVGKSTHVNRLAHHLIFNSDVSPTIVTLEATASQYSLDLLQTHVGKNFTFGKDGKQVMEFINTPEMLEYRKELAYREDGSPRYYMIDERSGSIKNIEKQMEEMLKRYGSKVFIIDVLTDLLRGSATEYAEDHMNFQKILVKEGCTIINVMHTVKLPLGEDGKVRDATEFDAFGTGSFVQSAAINIVLNRDKVSENNVIRNTTRATLAKCRGGITGDAGEWYFDFGSFTCHDLDEWKKDNPHMFK